MSEPRHASRIEVQGMNAELRKERRTFALPDHSGHVAFQVDTFNYWRLVHKYPDLGAADPTIARRAWLKFLNTEEGAPYKVNRTEGRRMPTHRIIVK